MLIWIVVFIGMSAALFIYSAYSIKKLIPVDNREFMDPLPSSLKMIWPFVRLISFYIGERLSIDYLEKTSQKLQVSGLSYILSAEDYFGVRVVSAFISSFFVWLCCALLGNIQISYILYGTIIGYFLPLLQLNDIKKKRQFQIMKALPVYLDFITMAVEAGLNLTGAINQAVTRGPKGPLKVEFEKVMRDLRSGANKIDAFRSMAERVKLSEIDNLVSALAQSERTGATLGSTLRVQADQRRIERFQRAEKQAMEAPVKLIFPLVIFIFPVTFAVLGFPVAMKVMYEM